jgi:hypothetical protein
LSLRVTEHYSSWTGIPRRSPAVAPPPAGILAAKRARGPRRARDTQHFGDHPGREAVARHRGGLEQLPDGTWQLRKPVCQPAPTTASSKNRVARASSRSRPTISAAASPWTPHGAALSARSHGRLSANASAGAAQIPARPISYKIYAVNCSNFSFLFDTPGLIRRNVSIIRYHVSYRTSARTKINHPDGR